MLGVSSGDVDVNFLGVNVLMRMSDDEFLIFIAFWSLQHD